MNITSTLDEQAVEAIARRVIEVIGTISEPAPEPWIDVAAAADHLGCKPRRIYDLVSQGRIDSARDGTRLLFRRSDLDAALERIEAK